MEIMTILTSLVLRNYANSGLITIIAILAILVGLIAIAGGAVLAFADVVPDGVDYGLDVINAMGYVTLIMGILMLVVGFTLWKGWTIAWYLGLILFGIQAVLGIANLVMGNYVNVVNLIIAVVVIYYLFRPHVKAFFKV